MRLYQAVLCLATLQRALGSVTQVSADDKTDTNETVVGWRANPTGRGTLSLLYSCLITIFACTWAVLHLNVPALDDSTWVRFARKIKWMGITILLPEFVFSKAVCELRLALKSLAEFEVLIGPCSEDSLRTRTSYGEEQHTVQTWNWQVEYGRVPLFLYQLMGLSRTHNLPAEKEERAANHDVYRGYGEDVLGSSVDGSCVQEGSSAESEDIQATRSAVPSIRDLADSRVKKYTISQHWTLAHAYLANMGGFVHSCWHTDCLLDKDTEYAVLTGAKLSRSYSWMDAHPLRGLLLSKDDIADKSKADWLLKTLAVLQIVWLIFTVAARGISSLPVTQLEIATLAFSIFAIATYAANFWKPKDVSRPVLVVSQPIGYGYESYDWTQSFVGRLVAPATTRGKVKSIRDVYRVKNDMIWMPPEDGDVPLVFYLMATSASIFGGLHCLAWNFEFPSRAELVLWRITSLASALIPMLSLVISIVLNYLATGHADKLLATWLVARMAPVAQFPECYLGFLNQAAFHDWAYNARFAVLSRALGSRTFIQGPSGEERNRTVEEVRQAEPMRWDRIWSLNTDVSGFMGSLDKYWRLWEQVTSGARKPRLLEDLRECHVDMRNRFLPQVRQVCDEYEALYARKQCGTPEAELPQIKCVSHIVAALEEFPAETKRIKKHREACEKVSRFSTIVGGILYIVVRLVILTLLFTSLRAVPPGVYESTPWTRFLPNFS